MPIETKRQAALLKNLQDIIKHTDPEIAAGRKLAIKRWAETYIENIKSFEGDKLQFLYNIFQNENCWSGARLDNAVLGQRLTEEKIGEIDNPLRRYDMACRYCVVDKIPSLFEEQFDSYKRSFSSNAVDGNGRPVKDDNKYILNSLLYGMKREDPVLSFWIDKESGELRQPGNAAEGFDSAVRLKWSEGVEYFYNHLKEEDKEKKLTDTILVLSRVQSVEKDAPILDFCVNKVADKDTLLQKLSQKDKGVYSLFAELIDSYFFDTVHDLVQCWCYKGVSERGGGDHSEKIFSYEEYKLLLSSLSNVMLENPEFNAQARSLIMEMWRCDRFYKHKEAAVDTSNFQVPIENALAGLVVNWERSGRKSDEKKEILEIILFAKDCFPEKFESFKEVMIEDLRLCGREGMKEDIDYGNFAKELFSELEKATLPPRDDGSGDYRRRSISIVEAEDSSLSIRHDGSGDAPKSILGTPGVSDFSRRSK
ncbi:cytoplasmic incompatibility factor CifA [Wolbachia endosymbiont (group B) of Rhopobota naevana]|uniref:cytoplasmic incompatibility factor CifA n=1 Tax=Wolbachia endosymbiont (group B) of Rhopobota naevana TaxID=2954054 RepID=UPI002225CC6F|nr:cytoplasmic incompatibility factor CifA [Wolbachia endosymbiont (group B) of Rhopobota naevana]